MTQGSLFDTGGPPRTKSAKAPDSVVAELVHKWGVAPATAKKWHARQAFVVLNSYRSRPQSATDQVRARKTLSATALTRAADTDDYVASELHDQLNEALSLLDRPELAVLCRSVAALLAPPTE